MFDKQNIPTIKIIVYKFFYWDIIEMSQDCNII